MSNDGTRLFAAAFDEYLYVSRDFGTSWSRQTTAGTQSWFAVAISADGKRLIASPQPDSYASGYMYTGICEAIGPTMQPSRSPSGPSASETDANALCDFYNTMPAEGKAKLTNWCGTGNSLSVCVGNGGTSSWLGVTCAVVGGEFRVRSINTNTFASGGAKNFCGSLPTSIGGLNALTVLDLGNAGIWGTIPSSLGSLTGLTVLGLQVNSLSGSIPSSLGGLIALTTLHFGVNSLSGTIPSSLGALTRLTFLSVGLNALTGSVPASFCSLQSSSALSFEGNPGLTCYPSCLSTFPNIYKSSSIGVCAAGTPPQANWFVATSPGSMQVGGSRIFTSSCWPSASVVVLAGRSGDDALLVRSADAGTTWVGSTYASLLQNTQLTDVACGAGAVVAVGKFGFVYFSTDLGATFTAAYTDATRLSAQQLNAVSVGSSGLAFIAANGGVLYKSGTASDGVSPSYASWTDASAAGQTFSASNLYGVFTSDGVRVYVVGAAGAIYVSANGGTSWSQVSTTASGSPVTADLYSVACGSLNYDTTCMVGGSSGTMLKTTNHGATWSAVVGIPGVSGLSTVILRFHSIGMFDSRIAFVAASNGVLASTLDAGATWTIETTLATGKTLTTISLFATNAVVAADTQGRAYLRLPPWPTGQPTGQPSGSPTRKFDGGASSFYTRCPTGQPSGRPSRQLAVELPMQQPTAAPTSAPSAVPTALPTRLPTFRPTPAPSPLPTVRPSIRPSAVPTQTPTSAPSGQPTGQPTNPTGVPTQSPTNAPTGQPTGQPTLQPTYVLQTLVRCNVTTALTGSGLNMSTFTANSSRAATAFAKAMARSINLASGDRTRLLYSAITIAKVTTVSARRGLSGQGHRRLAAGALVTATIATSTQQLGNSDAEASFAMLSTAVSSALSGPSFGAQLAVASSGIAALAGVSAIAAPPDISAASYTILRSGSPTGTPTSSPSRMVCSAGFRHDLYSPSCISCDAGTTSLLDATTCFDCKAGQMAPIAGSPACLDCAEGSYSPSKRSRTCSLCDWPAYTAFPGSSVCSAVCICATTTWVVIFYVLAIVFYISSLAVVGVKSPSLMLFSILPALDIISDLQYIIVTTFYSNALFIPCVIFVVAPSTLFVRRLWKMEALCPHFLVPVPQFLSDDTLLWLSQRHGFPLFRGEKMFWSYERHDTLYKLFGFWLLWVAVVVGQAACLLVYILLLSPLIVLHAPLWVCWLFFGFYLYQIKMMSVGKVWTIWFHVWRSKDLKKNGSGRLDSHVLVDTELMNESLFAAFFFETVPHLALQATNNQLLNRWTPVAYFSTTLSVFNCINGLYRSLYYIYFLGVDFADIPLEISIGTVTLSLDKATHLEGLEFKHDLHLLTRAEVEMVFLDKDNRFAEMKQLLRDPSTIRSHNYYGNGRYHLLPEPAVEEDEAKPGFFSRCSFKMHLGREKYDDSDPQYQWLVQLGQVVMEWENSLSPCLSDFFTNTIMKAFKAHGIVHERELHALLVRLRDADARRAFVLDELALDGRLYADMLCEYFARSWARLEAEGRGADYVYELGSKEEEEERLETFQHHDASQDLWREVDESGHQEYDAVPGDYSGKPPPPADDRLPPHAPFLPPSPPSTMAVSSFFSSLRPAASASAPPVESAEDAEDREPDAVVLHEGSREEEEEAKEAKAERPAEVKQA